MPTVDEKLDALLEAQGLKKKSSTSTTAETKKAKKVKEEVVVEAAPEKELEPAPSKSIAKELAQDRIELFCYRYIMHGFNATQAYQDLHPEVARTTASTEACVMLQKPEVLAVLLPLMEAMIDRVKVDAGWVLQRWKEQSEASPLDYFSIKNDGSLGDLDLSAITPAQKRNLKSVKVTRTTVTRDDFETVNETWTVSVVDQQKAVEMFARYFDMLSPGGQEDLDTQRIGDRLERGVKRIQESKNLDAWKDQAIEGQFSEVG